MGEIQSYKPHARLVTVISGLIIIIAGLDASQVVQLFPAYASQINTILVIAGIIAPAIAQEKRVVRAEEKAIDENEDITVPINVNVDADYLLDEIKSYIDELNTVDGSVVNGDDIA